jgi:hypothetical protein
VLQSTTLPSTGPGTDSGSHGSLTLAEIIATYGADTEQLLRTYFAQTGREVPPNLVDLIAVGDGDDLDLSDFSGWLLWPFQDVTASVYGYSTPTFLGRFPVVNGVVQVVGVDLTTLGTGEHHVLIVGDQSGDFEVAAVDLSEPTEEPVTTTAEPDPEAADTPAETAPAPGIPVIAILGIVAALLVLIAAITNVAARVRRRA